MAGRLKTYDMDFEDCYTPEPNSGCFLWLAGCVSAGYGTFTQDGRQVYAHRLAYERAKGPIPDGLEIDHLCRVPQCVNPDHLEAVTHVENIHRGNWFNENKHKTHCKNGHPLSGDNLCLKEPGRRRCIQCRRDAQLRYYYRAKDK